jgi:hypothetical protein
VSGGHRFSLLPVYEEEKHDKRHSREQHGIAAPELPAELQRVVERITRATRERAR